MSTATIGYSGPTMNYQVTYDRPAEAGQPRRSRRSSTTRRGNRPTGFNGMHRRKKKRWAW